VAVYIVVITLMSHLSSSTEDRTALNLDHDIRNYASRQEQEGALLYSTFGTSALRLDLTIEAWPRITQIFAAGSSITFRSCPGRPTCPLIPNVERLPRDVLIRTPVDLLVLGDSSPKRNAEWLERIPGSNAPKLVLEFWEPYWIVKVNVPMAKGQTTKWSERGFQSSCLTVDKTFTVVGLSTGAGWP
jgi:hypothetical protein